MYRYLIKMIAHDITEKKSSSNNTRFTIKPELLTIWIKFISCEGIERLLRLLGNEHGNCLTYGYPPVKDSHIANYIYNSCGINMSSNFKIEKALKLYSRYGHMIGNLLFLSLT